MRRTNLVLGLTLLLIAAATAVYTTAGSGKATANFSNNQRPSDPSRATNPPNSGWRDLDGPTSKSSRPIGSPVPVIETLQVEPFDKSLSAVRAQAARVETGALNRLEGLIDDLQLSDSQQLEIFPLLARSHPDYNLNLRLVGVPTGPIDPLGRYAADRKIHKILDPDQLLELEIKALESEMWWNDVIARLEKDLHDSTAAPAATGTAPNDDPTPPKDDPPPPPAVTPSAPHRGNNLFDLLQESGS